MLELSSPADAQRWTFDNRAAGRSVGLVPTMGALHEGHLSLVRMSQQRCERTIVSIFVNPTQFAPGEDFEKYPRTLADDLEKLRAESVAAVFLPTADQMYPAGYSTYVDPPEVALPLEGVCRPKHFRGVATVVLKLFSAVPADRAFFGRKDYQQWRVIEAMVRDLNLGIEIVSGDTVRESDGLALSSRNRYLSASERQRSLRIPRALDAAAGLVASGETNVAVVESAMQQILSGQQDDRPQAHRVDQIDYAVVVDAHQLKPLTRLDRPAVALIAARVGQTRLIDNRSLN